MTSRSLKQATRTTVITASLAAAMVLGAGCAATTAELDPNEPFHYDANYDFSDKKRIVDDLATSLLSASSATEGDDKPVLIVYGVANQTAEHIDTGGITDDIRLRLLDSGRYRFLNRVQRQNLATEVSYQTSGVVDPAQVVELGKQSGADYILAGTLRSIEKDQPRQWRLNKRKMVYYSLNLEMTSLVTGEITWADQVELAREASQPILRW